MRVFGLDLSNPNGKMQFWTRIWLLCTFIWSCFEALSSKRNFESLFGTISSMFLYVWVSISAKSSLRPISPWKPKSYNMRAHQLCCVNHIYANTHVAGHGIKSGQTELVIQPCSGFDHYLCLVLTMGILFLVLLSLCFILVPTYSGRQNDIIIACHSYLIRPKFPSLAWLL